MADPLQAIYELDLVDSTGQRIGTVEAEAALDELCALWVDRAPRFGAVAAHFPESLRKRRFVASFWASEVLLFGDLYLTGRRGMTWLGWPYTRRHVDLLCSAQVEAADKVPASLSYEYVQPAFWSPELPGLEVWR